MAEEKWHISPKTGKPERCKAEKGPCPIGGPHYGSQQEVEAAIAKGKKSSGLSKKSGRKTGRHPVINDSTCEQVAAKGSDMLQMFHDYSAGKVVI